ncbi:terminase small subunit [Burkholderia cenocepacia]|uniref:terminase small subunit n=1 Tax=Burkholderia cenocepacia TaxID=95486 RepID=UPI00222FA7D2|nr:terminase small subunit [Burkholderia cenocepacia]MCW3676294.1 terminase small subunit [Burkholderia cenocepacia]
MKKLTAKQQRFVDEYLIDLSASPAARRAGYSERTARVIANENLTKPDIQAAIAAAMKARSERTRLTADRVLQRMVEIDEMDVLDIMNDDMSLKPVSEWPKVWRQYLSGFDLAELFEGNGDAREMVGILKKIKWPDKLKNLEMLGRHFGMFNDKVRLQGDKNAPLTVVIKDLTGRKPLPKDD